MTPFAIVAGLPGSDEAELASALKGAQGRSLSAEALSSQSWLLTSAKGVSLGQCGGAVVVGEIFDRTGHPVNNDQSLAPCLNAMAAHRLTRTTFGRYLALWFNHEGALDAFLSDPSGALPIVWWRTGSVLVVSTDPSPIERRALPKADFDWLTIALWLSDPSTMPVTSGLHGIEAAVPGALIRPNAGGAQIDQVWRPSEVAHPPTGRGEATDALTDAVDRSVLALAARKGALIAETSGGFDSSVVAASLRKARKPVAAWLNFASEDPGGDERAYAGALADHLGAPLTIRSLPASRLSPTDISETQYGFRPSLNGLDALYESAVIEEAARCNAQAVVTGVGGDASFFQLRHPILARDLWLNRKWAGLTSPEFIALARWTRTSIYQLARLALAPPTDVALSGPPPRWLTVRPPAFVHPWLEGLSDFGPAKRLHVRALTHMLGSYAPSRRGRALDLIHPLISQPVFEAVLPIPVDLLVEGGRDRALARSAFADRLPEMIVERRSKGDVSAHHARSFVAALGEIGVFLAEGELAHAGLIDAESLGRALDEAVLAQTGGQLEILRAVAIEAWARYWTAR